MIEEAQDFIPIWMLLSAAFGFMIGDAFGDSRRHRQCLEEANEDLRDQLRRIHESYCTGNNAASSTTSTSTSSL